MEKLHDCHHNMEGGDETPLIPDEEEVKAK